MYSYNVYFTAKPGYTDAKVAQRIHAFGKHEIQENLMHSYSLQKFDNKASFKELYDFHFAAHYQKESERKQAFEKMSKDYTKEPHLGVMKMTKTFKVAFSVDL